MHGTTNRYQVRLAVNGLLDTDNAAPEWQATSLGLRSRYLVVACPFEGLVRRWRNKFIPNLQSSLVIDQ